MASNAERWNGLEAISALEAIYIKTLKPILCR